MRTRRVSEEHREAVSRRLEQLRAELAAVRADPAEGRSAEPAVETDGRTGPEVREATGEEATGDWWQAHTRVRRVGDDLPLVEPPPTGPPPTGPPPGGPPPMASPPPTAPMPGRHAARRRGRVVAEVLPPTLRGRVGLGAPQVAVVAVLVAVGLAITCWWVVRGAASGEEVVPVAAPAGSAQPLVPVPTGTSGTAAPGTTAGAVPTGTVTVDVAGKVRRPGIAVLPVGSRVVDALEAAGGARAGVDLSALNLARLLVDGEQVRVGVAPPPGAVPGAATVPGAASPTTVLVNLNTATQVQLESLPDVGPVTAQAILAWRQEHGGFTAVDELLEVDGIGEATLARLAPLVTV